MEEFDFNLDMKVTMWRREKFSIKAKSIEEASKMAVEAIKDGQTHLYHPYYEELYDTSEEMSIEDNGGQPTLELFTSYISADPIWTNVENNN